MKLDGSEVQMKKGYPDYMEAEKIWEECIEDSKSRLKGDTFYFFHARMVASMAAKLAQLTKKLDVEKAFVCGLFHDCGKVKGEKTHQNTHGVLGYEMMKKLGYGDVAKICLTHTFPNKNLQETKIGYPDGWLEKAQIALDKYEYDDYDRLIQFCDKLCDGEKCLSYEQRALDIQKRYNAMQGYSITDDRYQELLEEGCVLKSYFDQLCECDVYDVLGIEKIKNH